MSNQSLVRQKQLAKLDLYLLNTKDPAPEERELVEKAFILWKKSWEQTFSQLNVNSRATLFADDFLAREAIALFDRDQPVALFFNHQVTFAPSQLHHSYFMHYPAEIFTQLKNLGFQRCLILSYMTVLPEYRKSQTDVPMFELLFSLGVKCFQRHSYECLLGYIRKDLSFHQSFERHGGLKIAEGHVYNVDVDYLYMTKASMKLSPLPGVAEVAQTLWEKMLFRKRATAHQLTRTKKSA